MWCKTCGYVLDGLAEPRCPECSRPFIRGDDSTYILGPRLYVSRLAVAAFSLGVVSVAPCLTGFVAPVSAIPLLSIAFGIGAIVLGFIADRWVLAGVARGGSFSISAIYLGFLGGFLGWCMWGL
jgi:hypothetical protein